MKADRMSGVVVALLGLVLFVLVIPAHTETVDYGWTRPQTIPDICAFGLMIFGAMQAVFPAGKVDINLRETARVILFAIISAAAVWAMSRFGFRVAAPAFALVLMLLVGERRPVWLGAGAIVLPALIWLVAVPLLDRTLP